jgi:hypothetical protein
MALRLESNVHDRMPVSKQHDEGIKMVPMMPMPS